MKSSEHRPEIAGLRAIAVSAVLLFHAQVAGFSGGFAGVDVFFVISGFLITGKIRRERERGRFSFAGFYMGRVRRLLPSVVATLAMTLLAGALILNPAQLKALAMSTLASSVFVPNIYFWQVSGYFGPASETQPLLHFWSLGVEEQFYLIWPLLLSVLLLLPRRAIFAALAMIGAASIAASEFVIRSSDFEAVTAFYWMPFRAAEFAIGAALVWLPASPVRYGVILSAVGLFLIGATMVFVDEIYFPGIPALLPCLGAAAVIAAGRNRLSDIALGNRVATFLGDISYVLYLVHWPIIVYWRMIFGPLAPADQIAVLLLSVVAGATMHYAIEHPLWRGFGASIPSMRYLSGAVAASLAVCAVAWSAHVGNGWPWRLPELAQRWAAQKAAGVSAGRRRRRRIRARCRTSAPASRRSIGRA